MYLLKLLQMNSKSIEYEQFDVIRGSFVIELPDGTRFDVQATSNSELQIMLIGTGYAGVLPQSCNVIKVKRIDWG